jgi:hypothetical protein
MNSKTNISFLSIFDYAPCRYVHKAHFTIQTGVTPTEPKLWLTPGNKALSEKVTGPQLAKKFPAFYGTRKFITAFTCAQHLSVSSARSIQSMPPHPTSRISTLISYSHLRLKSSTWFPSLRSTHQNPVCASPVSHTCHKTRQCHSSWFDHPNNIWWKVQIFKLLVMYATSFLLRPNTFFSTLFSNTSAHDAPSMWVTKSHTHTKQQAILQFCIS